MTVTKKEQAAIDKNRAEAKAQAEKEAAEAAEAAEAKEVKPPYSVAEGRAITTKRGILGPGAEIKAEDLANGQKGLEAFVKSKHIIKA